jgi:hypothetical protein
MVPRNSEENRRPLFRGDVNAKTAAKIRQDQRQRPACCFAPLHAGAKIIEMAGDKPGHTPR